MKERITAQLRNIEREHDVKILYAVESGSRAWEIASEGSDYDVRFLYVHRRDSYLRIDEQRDVIECPIDDVLDISGWDLKKALRLLAKSNPALLEWLRSPIVYEERGDVPGMIRAIGASYLSKRASMYHYLHMAKGNYKDYLQGESVKVKKYLYVIRPLLVCMWLERNETIPPVAFEELLHAQHIQSDIMVSIRQLLARKKAGEELRKEERHELIHTFIEEKLAYYEQFVKTLEQEQQTDIHRLNELFRNALSIWE